MSRLDENSAIPIYYQIAVDLRRRISSREWSIDDKIPSGAALATEYGVNHMTINQALSDLMQMLMGPGSIAFGGAAVLAAWPLFLVWGVARWWKQRRG